MTRTKRILALLAASNGSTTVEHILSALSDEDVSKVRMTIRHMVHLGYMEDVSALRITDGGMKRLAHRRLTREEYRERYRTAYKISAIRRADSALGAM